jgi:hypothetical protein
MIVQQKKSKTFVSSNSWSTEISGSISAGLKWIPSIDICILICIGYYSYSVIGYGLYMCKINVFMYVMGNKSYFTHLTDSQVGIDKEWL